jgi:hypothetical protein
MASFTSLYLSIAARRFHDSSRSSAQPLLLQAVSPVNNSASVLELPALFARFPLVFQNQGLQFFYVGILCSKPLILCEKVFFEFRRQLSWLFRTFSPTVLHGKSFRPFCQIDSFPSFYCAMAVDLKLARCFTIALLFPSHRFNGLLLEFRRVFFVRYPFWHENTPKVSFSISYCPTSGVRFSLQITARMLYSMEKSRTVQNVNTQNLQIMQPGLWRPDDMWPAADRRG